MPPKKLTLPLPLPLKPTTNQQEQHRITPAIIIDPHVCTPLLEHEHELNQWYHSIDAVEARLGPLQPVFKGSVYLHHPPQQLELKHCWIEEQEKIIKIDGQLANLQRHRPLAQLVWAPLNQGPQPLTTYLDQITTKTQIKISGCCHLIQPRSSSSSLLDPSFIDCLKLLGSRGLTVELFVQSNRDRSAASVLDDVLECVAAVRLDQDPEHQTKFILCQMGMPEMISSQSTIPSSASCSSILSRLFSLSLFSNLDIKLTSLPIIPDERLSQEASGRFTSPASLENPSAGESMTSATLVVDQTQDGEEAHEKATHEPGKARSEAAWREMKKRIKFYLEPILEAFGDHRVIYASGYPYFDLPSQEASPIADPVARYQYQFEIVRECLCEFGLKNEALDNLFGRNAQRCYGI